MSIAAPYGSWPSPLLPESMAGVGLRISGVRLGPGGAVYWTEGRPAEAGRTTLMRRRPGAASAEDLLAVPWNVRSRVHEYGGLSYAVVPAHGGERVVFVHFADQRLYERAADGSVTPLTAEGTGWRLADLVLDAPRQRLLAVGELHAAGDGHAEPRAALVAIALTGPARGQLEVLQQGDDFYAAPTLSPDGTRLAFLAWSHPHMPWDAARVDVAALDAAGRPHPGSRRRVAGDDRASAVQPAFGADGALYFVHEPEGFWNLFRAPPAALDALLAGPPDAPPPPAKNLCPMQAELAQPLWTLGARTWAFVDSRRIAAIAVANGRAQLGLIDIDQPARGWQPVEVPGADGALGQLQADPSTGQLVVLVGWSDRGMRIERFAAGGAVAWQETVHSAVPLQIPAAFTPPARPVSFPTSAGDMAHGFFYAPCHPERVTGMPGERPPLLVVVHGGPTTATLPVATPGIQFWTSRGIAVLDVNYRGSSGYGRPYRDRLRGQWGIFDVDDCVAGATWLADQGLVDGERLAIRGGSAGGYTVLAALIFGGERLRSAGSGHQGFAAGASHFGVSDLESLARDTHKFESRYMDALVGPYPAARDTYVARSPIHFVERLARPVIFFQGLDDQVVPPAQAETMVEALRQKGIATEYRAFAGEGHGFRQASTVREVFTAELAFYGRVFGFTPSG
jgi:dipeptidyl aminopeptidase/acylaminoacyl peptidase